MYISSVTNRLRCTRYAVMSLSILLFWQDYASVSQKELRSFLLARLKVFYEEELDVPLVL